ncbi:MAG: hypothetical protein HQL23_01695, partial [Candidatus Omnitrophica bacterium]|nr:hypothetical protein [Candidatus Omnitrophota bacterium]
ENEKAEQDKRDVLQREKENEAKRNLTLEKTRSKVLEQAQKEKDILENENRELAKAGYSPVQEPPDQQPIEGISVKGKTEEIDAARVEETKRTQAKEIAENKRQEREALREKQKQDRELALRKKEQELREKYQRAEDLKKLKAEMEATYQDAVRLYEQGQVELSLAQFEKFEQMMKNDALDEAYLNKVRRRLVKDRERFKKMNGAKSEVVVGGVPIPADQQADLKKMAEKIRVEEDQLAKEKKLHEQKVAEEKQRIEALKNQPEAPAPQPASSAEAVTAPVSKDAAAAKSNPGKAEAVALENMSEGQLKQAILEQKGQIQQLIAERQGELHQERQKVQKELEGNVEELYVRAVHLARSKLYRDAKQAFLEVEDVAPDYKKTRDYMTKMDGYIAEAEQKSSTAAPEGVSASASAPPAVKSRLDIIRESLDAVQK